MTMRLDTAQYILNDRSGNPAPRRNKARKQDQQRREWAMTTVEKEHKEFSLRRRVNAVKTYAFPFIPDEGGDSGDGSLPRFRPPPQGIAQRAARIGYITDRSGYSTKVFDIRAESAQDAKLVADFAAKSPPITPEEGTRREFVPYTPDKPAVNEKPGSDSLQEDDHKSSGIAADEFGGGYRYKRTDLDSTVSSTISQDKTSGECARNAKLLAGFAQKSLRLTGPQGGTLDTTSLLYLRIPVVRGTPMIDPDFKDDPASIEMLSDVKEGDTSPQPLPTRDGFVYGESMDGDIVDPLWSMKRRKSTDLMTYLTDDKNATEDFIAVPGSMPYLADGKKATRNPFAPARHNHPSGVEYEVVKKKDRKKSKSSGWITFIAGAKDVAKDTAEEEEEEFSTLPKYGEGKYTPRFTDPSTIFEGYLRSSTTRREPAFATPPRRVRGYAQSDDGYQW